MSLKHFTALCLAACALAGCGIKGNLVRPKDIPAYEKGKHVKPGPLLPSTQIPLNPQ